jgi:hypothetical protein
MCVFAMDKRPDDFSMSFSISIFKEEERENCFL